MKWIVGALFVALVAGIYAENEVPVFIWGDVGYANSPILNSDAYLNLDEVLAGDNLKVIFVENQLFSMDLNHCEVDGRTCFKFLGEQSAKFYSPTIESPVLYLESKFWEGEVETKNTDDKIEFEAGKTVFVHFRKQRYHHINEKFAAHDREIRKVVEQLGTKGVTYVYTGKTDGIKESHHRFARQAKQDNETTFLHQSTHSIVFLRGIATGPEEDIKPLDLGTLVGTSTITTGEEDTSIKISIEHPGTPANNLEFDIKVEGGRWWVEQMSFGGRHFRNRDWIGANLGFSYSCSPTMTFISPNTTDLLELRGLQLEVLRQDSNESMIFSESWNCVGFTSGGIWGGLFVTFILLFILSIGIVWMMDINTMDRFDDPKGKTIIINAQD